MEALEPIVGEFDESTRGSLQRLSSAGSVVAEPSASTDADAEPPSPVATSARRASSTRDSLDEPSAASSSAGLEASLEELFGPTTPAAETRVSTRSANPFDDDVDDERPPSPPNRLSSVEHVSDLLDAVQEHAPALREFDAEELEDKLREISEGVPTMVCNTAGSTAGAGSGGFHSYRQQKRRNQIREAAMEADLKREKEQTAFDARKAELAKVEENKTAKRRAKRQKLKAKKRAKKGSKAPVVGPSVAPAGPEGGPDRPGKPDPASKHVFTRRSKP